MQGVVNKQILAFHDEKKKITNKKQFIRCL